jgi:uncharacterized protein (DUF488 family)
MNELFLTGYEGEKIDDFLTRLESTQVTAVVDVREIPLSRKNGFSGNSLEKELSVRGIRYYPFSELGSPGEIREELYSTGDYLSFFKQYRKYLHTKKTSIKNLDELISNEKRATLLCFEKNHELCHRSIIANELIKIHPHLQVIPL